MHTYTLSECRQEPTGLFRGSDAVSNPDAIALAKDTIKAIALNNALAKG
jgi:hypothetical protein